MHCCVDEQGSCRSCAKFKHAIIKATPTFLGFMLGYCLFYSFQNIHSWSEYKQAKVHANKFQSTTCRIEGIITEEILSDENQKVEATSINAFFLVKVMNSSNKNDQLQLAKIPLRKSGQHSLVNSSLACFYDPLGIEQARLTLPDVFTAKLRFGFWCCVVSISTVVFLMVASFGMILLVKVIRQYRQSGRQTTTPIGIQLNNSA